MKRKKRVTSRRKPVRKEGGAVDGDSSIVLDDSNDNGNDNTYVK